MHKFSAKKRARPQFCRVVQIVVQMPSCFTHAHIQEFVGKYCSLCILNYKMIKTKHTWRRTSNVGVMTTTGNKEHGLWLPGIEYLEMEENRE